MNRKKRPSVCILATLDPSQSLSDRRTVTFVYAKRRSMMHTVDETMWGEYGVNMPVFGGMGFYQQPVPQIYLPTLPRVVPDQKRKFEDDTLFRKLSRETEVHYTSYKDRPLDERKLRFHNSCLDGHVEIAFANTGTNLHLIFGSKTGDPNECDFNKERGKVFIKSRLIMNGVCVRWCGYIDLKTLTGAGSLEFDEERAALEAAKLSNTTTTTSVGY